MAIKKALFLCLIFFSDFALSMSDYIQAAALSSDRRLAVGYAQGTIQIFNIHEMRTTKQIKASDQMIESLNFSNDNMMLVGTSDKQVMIWDVASGALFSSWKVRSPYTVTNASFGPHCDRVLVSAYGLVKVYNLKGEELYRLPENSSAKAIFNHGGTKIAVSDFNQNRISVYDVQTGLKDWSTECYWPSHIAFSPVENKLAIASSLKLKLYNLDESNSMREFEFDHGGESFHDYDNWIISLNHNHAGNRVLFFDNKGCLFNIDLKTKFERHLQNLGSVKFSAFFDNSEIIVVTSRKIMKINAESMEIKTAQLVTSDLN